MEEEKHSLTSGRGQVKKQLILEQAKIIFANKGYKRVTMQDVVDACGISRGGIYLYFKSIRELFEAVLEQEKNKEVKFWAFDGQHKTMTPEQKLLSFFEEQKWELLEPHTSFIQAIYEYQSETWDEKPQDYFQGMLRASVEQLEEIVAEGVKVGSFAVDAHVAAEHIVFFIEGLRLTSIVCPFDEVVLDRQFAYLMLGLRGPLDDYQEEEGM